MDFVWRFQKYLWKCYSPPGEKTKKNQRKNRAAAKKIRRIRGFCWFFIVFWCWLGCIFTLFWFRRPKSNQKNKEKHKEKPSNPKNQGKDAIFASPLPPAGQKSQKEQEKNKKRQKATKRTKKNIRENRASQKTRKTTRSRKHKKTKILRTTRNNVQANNKTERRK